MVSYTRIKTTKPYKQPWDGLKKEINYLLLRTYANIMLIRNLRKLLFHPEPTGYLLELKKFQLESLLLRSSAKNKINLHRDIETLLQKLLLSFMQTKKCFQVTFKDFSQSTFFLANRRWQFHWGFP